MREIRREVAIVKAENQEQRLREKIRNILEATYVSVARSVDQGYVPLEYPGLLTGDAFDMPDNWGRLFEVEEVDNEGRYQLEYQKRAAIFFNEFLDFVQQKRRANTPPNEVQLFCSKWYQAAFSVSPNLFNALPMKDEFVIGARLHAYPETRTSLGMNVVRELVYNLNFSEGDFAWIQNIFETYPLERQLEVLHYMEYVARYANGQGYSEELAPRLLDELDRQANLSDLNPFYRIVLSEVIKRIERDYAIETSEWVSLDELPISEQQRLLREWEKQKAVKAAERARPRIHLEHEGKNDKIELISRDYLASFDPNDQCPQRMAPRPAIIDVTHSVTIPSEPFEAFEANESILPRGSGYAIDSAVLLKELHQREVFARICTEFEFDLRELSLREQVHFLAWMAQTNQKDFEEAVMVIRTFGMNAARAFLSCEHGKHFGDAILDIAKKLDPASAEAVFAKYCEIVDATERTTEELLSEFYVTENGRAIDRGKVNEEILVRAKEVLALCAKELQDAGENPVTGADILRKLSSVQKDTILFAGLFKTLAKGKDVDFRELRGVTFEQKRPVDMGETEKKEMTDILKENWRAQKASVADWVEAGFEKKIAASNTDTRFYVLKKDHRVMAFMRFDERPDLGANTLYAGSLNVSPMLRGSALGEAVLRSTVDEEAKQHVIYADFFPEISAGTMYIEQMGWVVTGVEEVQVDAKGTREQRFVMVRDDERNASLRTRSMAKSDLIRMADGRGRDGIQVIRFEFPGQVDRFTDEVKRATQSGHGMTRYFSDDSASRVRYAVFEPTPVYSAESRIAA